MMQYDVIDQDVFGCNLDVQIYRLTEQARAEPHRQHIENVLPRCMPCVH